MKKLLLIVFTFFIVQNIFSIEINADLFSFDEEKFEKEFENLNKLEQIVILNPEFSFNELVDINPDFLNLSFEKKYFPQEINYTAEPGNISSFWWSFSFSLVGSYTLYGAVAGPISVGVVYLSSKKDRIETKKAVWGCLTGTILGFGLKYAVLTFM
ncbi:MAG: hypothetical protein JXR51_06785 [Bacteroidales bacterium]|nr:hypothetical protein [Bacteroidales bacterium]MBN2756869.1 hypothetical protein [Bacteroidales bacterium]